MCRMMGVVSRGPVYYDLFEEFADLADALFLHVFEDAVEHFLDGALGVLAAAVEFDVGADQRAEEPGEGGALMVGAVTNA